MRFCERFGMTPLEYAGQPADTIALWDNMIQVEAEADKLRSAMAAARGMAQN